MDPVDASIQTLGIQCIPQPGSVMFWLTFEGPFPHALDQDSRERLGASPGSLFGRSIYRSTFLFPDASTRGCSPCQDVAIPELKAGSRDVAARRTTLGTIQLDLQPEMCLRVRMARAQEFVRHNEKQVYKRSTR